MRLKAYLRLQNIKTHSNDRETFINQLESAINQKRFSDLDRSIMIKELSKRHEESIIKKSKKLESEYLQTEKAVDYTKFAV